MKLPNWLVKIAEIIFKGRQAGMWSEKHGSGGLNLDQPHKPEDIKGIKK
ncbi:MAG: hypothetical protein GY906_24830 [bacterium]|nr:hypothetical protein [bacterium]